MLNGIEQINFDGQLNADLPPAFKYETFPLQRNQILLRVENIGDKFDTDYRSMTI